MIEYVCIFCDWFLISEEYLLVKFGFCFVGLKWSGGFMLLCELELVVIELVLDWYNGNKMEVVEELGVSFKMFYNKFN